MKSLQKHYIEFELLDKKRAARLAKRLGTDGFLWYEQFENIAYGHRYHPPTNESLDSQRDQIRSYMAAIVTGAMNTSGGDNDPLNISGMGNLYCACVAATVLLDVTFDLQRFGDESIHFKYFFKNDDRLVPCFTMRGVGGWEVIDMYAAAAANARIEQEVQEFEKEVRRIMRRKRKEDEDARRAVANRTWKETRAKEAAEALEREQKTSGAKKPRRKVNKVTKGWLHVKR